MLYHILYQRILHIRWIGHLYTLYAVGGLQHDRFVGEDRETQLSSLAYHLDAVFLRRLMCHEAPGATARQSRLKAETGAHGVFCLIESTSVGTYPIGLEYDAEDMLQQVELMWCEVVEEPTSCYIWLESPREVSRLIVEVGCWHGEAHLYIDDFAQHAALDRKSVV